jgi:hypothetical protein
MTERLKNKRSLLKRVVFTLILIVLTLALMEGGLRMAGIGESVIYEASEAYGYRPEPSQHFRTLGYPVLINEHGFRGTVTNSSLMFVGDSITYGCAFVKDEETFAHRLEGLNAGVNGWGIPNIEAYLKHTDLEGIEHVIWVIPSCDIFRPFTTLRDGLISTNRRIIFRLTYLYRFIRYAIITKQPELRHPEHFEANREAVLDTASYLENEGIQLTVVFLPYRNEAKGEEVREGPYIERMKKALDQRNISYIATMPPEPVDPLYHDIGHLTAEGHAWLADVIKTQALNNDE